MWLLSVLAFVVPFLLLFGLPLAPGFIEIARGRDALRLEIDDTYTREPRFFGRSFRSKIAALLDVAPAKLPYSVAFLNRGERALVDLRIAVPPKTRETTVLLGLQELEIGSGSHVADGFGKELVLARERSHARALASDGTMILETRTRIERWVDADGALYVGNHCVLGQSAASGSDVFLGAGTRFSRVFGSPVHGPSVDAPVEEKQRPTDATIVPADSTVDDHIIARQALIVESGAVVNGSLKAYGTLFIGPHAEIAGSVIGRGDVVISEDAAVSGYVFCEGRLHIGARARIGSPGRIVTAYGSRGVELHAHAVVYGWLVTDRKGIVAG